MSGPTFTIDGRNATEAEARASWRARATYGDLSNAKLKYPLCAGHGGVFDLALQDTVPAKDARDLIADCGIVVTL